ncbi:uncharacterized protein LOC119441118 [Dermacentor silvarum]|uniref:uncharacterized protein LOC119441118 n=1 Tax=Dermacentor silvarum TaxID=543639 RepID=UPI0021017CFE|nr:uncharacterized protein LOC119441118 [Dermacentor silvarum]
MGEQELPLIKNAMSLKDRKYTIRELKYEELPQLVKLWKTIGFMVSADLVDSLWKCDRAGIIAAVADDDGEVIGSCCAPFVGEGMAKLWLHGLLQQYRNQGLGTELADRAMEHIGDANAYTLCIPEHEHIYLNKYQFNVSSRLFQILGPAVPRLTGVITSLAGVRVMESERGVRELLLEYDTDIVGFNRTALLDRMLKEKNTMLRIALRDDNQIGGYGFISEGVHGAAIVRHLSADSIDIAELLLGRLFRDFAAVASRGVWAVGCIQSYESHSFFKKFNLKSIHEMKLLRRRGVDNDMSRVYVFY